MKNDSLSSVAIRLLFLSLSVALVLAPQSSEALPAIVARATDSISALLSASGRQQPQLLQQIPQQQQQAAAPAGQTSGIQEPQQQQQQQQWIPSSNVSSSIQAQFSAIQAQAQRQLNQLVGGAGPSGAASAVSNFTTTANRYGSNVLEVLSNVGKAIQQQISGNGQIQIMNSAPSGGQNELANTKKNEYQSIVITDPPTPQQQQQQQQQGQLIGGVTNQTVNHREQSEQLRQEILRRVGQLQQVVASSMDLLKNNGDLIVRRLLEQLNHRLDQAKSKADKIISEPATNEVAIKALTTINQGLNNLNNIITNIVNKLELSAKEANSQVGQAGGQQELAAAAAGGAGGLTQRGSGTSTGLLLDPARFKMNLHQLGQQFSSAISAVHQQRQLQQQQQQQGQLQKQLLQPASNIVAG